VPSDVKPKLVLGFLTVVEHSPYGLFGGYLVLNAAGRPLEFHCTTPVKPNRAQEILYGATLEPYLYGEQIGQTLVSKSKSEPQVICTDREPALAVREFVSTPVVLVLPPAEETISSGRDSDRSALRGRAEQQGWRLDPGHTEGARLHAFPLGRNRLAVPADVSEDRQRIAEKIGSLCESLDLLEPFQRIRDAIDEARRGGA
jgi:hypothetical protein